MTAKTIVRRQPQARFNGPDDFSPLLKRIYSCRGITDEHQLNRSLSALLHYRDLKGIESAAALIADAVIAGQRIVIVGDFDADGATSTALCMLSLQRLGSTNHHYLVPNRFDFGYGLSPEIVDVAAQQGAELIVTVDSGIACVAGVDKARTLGIKVVITDHHLPGEILPDADGIVNPNQPGCEFPSKNLAGVGVAFYTMLATKAELSQRDWFSERQAPNLAELLDIVALGTVADVVPLDHNNRILVHQGIQRIKSGRCRPGITAMFEVAGRKQQRLSASDLGFVIGPRLNAAGRLEDMSEGIECLLCENMGEARQRAVQLDSLNQQRRDIEASMQSQAREALEHLDLSVTQQAEGICLYQPDWHQGVIGIVAGRIKEQYHRPTIAFAHQDEHTVKGSARSINGIHIRDLLDEVNTRYPAVISKFGGHAMAAGLSLPLEQLENFKQAFAEVSRQWLATQDLQQHIVTDGALSAAEMNLEQAQQLLDAGPWGQGFEEPLFDGQFELVDQRLVGQKHLKMQLVNEQGELFDGIAFNIDTDSWPNKNIRRVTLAYKLDINEFRGKVSVQFLVSSIEPADS